MRLVIDTNLMLGMTNPRAQHHWLFLQLLDAAHTLLLTTEILEEYEEIAGQYLKSRERAEVLMQMILNLPDVELVTTHYQWQLITADVDDNKFVDCAINANADCIITEDRHFNVLKQVAFPKVVCYKIAEFKKRFYHPQ